MTALGPRGTLEGVSRRRFAAKHAALAPVLALTLGLQGCGGLGALAGIFTQLSSALGPVQQIIGLVSQLPGSPLSSGIGQKVLGVVNTVGQVGSKVQQAAALTNRVRNLDATRLSPVDTVQQAASIATGTTRLLGVD